MSLLYYDESSPNVTIQWNNIQSIHSSITERGTHVEMVSLPPFGDITCYMNNVVQSCETDEYVYHETLVHPAMACACSRKRIMIMGGGEGATAREVLKWPDVEQVDMHEWDTDIVNMFKEKYPQWAKGAWKDPRLTIHTTDIFEVIQTNPVKKYDVIIIDLFDYDEEDNEKWETLLFHLPFWTNGTVVIYAGMRSMRSMRSICSTQPYQVLAQLLQQNKSPVAIESANVTPSIHDHFLMGHDINPYRVFIPSFLGEATFLLIKPKTASISYDRLQQFSHITRDVWKSYNTFNW